MCTFLFWMEHCGIWNRCILGFVKLVYWIPMLLRQTLEKLKWKLHFQENAFQDVICQVKVILFKPQCVKQSECVLWTCPHWIVSYGHVHIGSAFHTSLSLPQHTSLLIELSLSVSLAWRHPAEEYKLLQCRNWLHWTVKGHHGDCLIGTGGIAADNKYRADSRFVPSQWETALLCNDISHWLGTSLESALKYKLIGSRKFLILNLKGCDQAKWCIIISSGSKWFNHGNDDGTKHQYIHLIFTLTS